MNMGTKLCKQIRVTGDCFRVYVKYLAQIRVSSFGKRKYRNTNVPLTVASTATSSRKRRRSIALNSRLAVISSTSPATRALQLQTFSLPNSSSTPPSAHRAPCSLALTWPTSTLTLRWLIRNTCASDSTSSLRYQRKIQPPGPGQ